MSIAMEHKSDANSATVRSKRSITRMLPTLLTIAALGAIAYWGHRNDWKLPKFSELIGSREEAKVKWCEEHGVPELKCVECVEGLMPRKSYGWCEVHGVHDCVLEHPDVAQLPTTPTISAEMLSRARSALAFTHRTENEKACKLPQRRIQFPDHESVKRAGIEPAVVREAPMIEAIPVNGEIVYDPNLVARVSSRAPGSVWRAFKQIGDKVTKGEVLAIVDVEKVGQAKADLLRSLAQVELHNKTVERLRPLVGDAVAAAQFAEAEAALNEAQVRVNAAQQSLVNLGLPVRADDLKGLKPADAARRLQFLGLPDDLAKTLDPQTTSGNLLVVRAPRAGAIVAREAVEGDVVDSTRVLFVVADTSRMWLNLAIRQEDALTHSLVGNIVHFRPHGERGELKAPIVWVSPAVDDKTRIVTARAELDNAVGRLRANTFGTGRVILREEPRAIVLPNTAVHWEGDCHVVFVRDKDYMKEGSPKVFHVRSVRPAAKDDKHTELAVGVLPGEVVADSGSSVLLGELLHARLGEG